jgi:dTMP kinase
MQGKFITFEGADASGKTSNIPLLADHLRERGYKVVTTREPGGNPVGDKIRDVLLDNSLSKMDSVTELLLFIAARNENVTKFVRPHLDAGYIVLCDRFHDSTYAYQGYARGMLGQLVALGEYVNGGIMPDYTLFFDLPLEQSMRRLALRSGKQDRLDLEEEDFRQKVYRGYQTRFDEVKEEGRRGESNRSIHRIDASAKLEQVTDQVTAWANGVFANLS